MDTSLGEVEDNPEVFLQNVPLDENWLSFCFGELEQHEREIMLREGSPRASITTLPLDSLGIP